MESSILELDSYLPLEVSNPELQSNIIDGITCVESSENHEDLSNCDSLVSRYDDSEVMEIYQFRKSWMQAGLLVKDISAGEFDKMEKLKTLISSLKPTNKYFPQDFTKEMKIVEKLVTASKQQVKSVIEGALKGHPAVEYSH